MEIKGKITDNKVVCTDVNEESAYLYKSYWDAVLDELQEGLIDADDIPAPKDYWFLCHAMLSTIEKEYNLEWNDIITERGIIISRMAWVLINSLQLDFKYDKKESEEMMLKLENV